MNKTQLILKYCRDLAAMRKEHARWCELETGLWHSCDCGLDDSINDLVHIYRCIMDDKARQFYFPNERR